MRSTKEEHFKPDLKWLNLPKLTSALTDIYCDPTNNVA